ncbi:MAG: hypothetical protein IPG64_06160 [Haliea sp.]|nr:hypothetical protein [Haliea sp.]
MSERWPWMNLLNLNFGYHSVHHDRPATPVVPPAGSAPADVCGERPAGAAVQGIMALLSYQSPEAY